MIPANYEGPRHGDYVRYVEDLLRASPSFRASANHAAVVSRSDFTNAAHTPGAQPDSVMARLRERAQAAAAQAQQEMQARPQGAGQGNGGNARSPRKKARAQVVQEATAMAERAAREAALASRSSNAGWFKITPGRIVFLLILAGLSVAFPGLGVFLLLGGIIHAVRKGIRSASGG